MALLSLTLRVSHPDRTRKTLSTCQRIKSEQRTRQNIQKLGKFFNRKVMDFVITADSPLKMAVHGASTICRILPSKPSFKIKNKKD